LGTTQDEKSAPPTWEGVVDDAVTPEEIEAENAVALPNKEVLSLLDVNANVDLGLDLAAPVDLAAAANLNVAAPIEAAAAANVLSPGAEAVGLADQQGTIDQGISGSATATAPQHADVAQTSGSSSGGTTDVPTTTGTAPTTLDGSTTGTTGSTLDGSTTGTTGSTLDGVTSAGTSTADSLLNGGSLLNANINIDATANLAAPIDGAVAANANVAAPIEAAVGANIGSPDAVAEAVAPQDVSVTQSLDNVTADATATQDANVQQQ
jgi:hypothetical protein